MKRSSKLLLGASLLGIVAYGATEVSATDIDVDATMTVSAAVSLTKDSDLDFGGLDFVPTHSATGVSIGTDGVISFDTAIGLTATGTASAGQISVASTSGTIEISCEVSAIIDDGTRPLTFTAKWDVLNSVNYTTAANTCAGLGSSPVAIDTTSSNNPVIYVAANFAIASNYLVGSSGGTPYNTSTGNGDPLTFRVVFQ